MKVKSHEVKLNAVKLENLTIFLDSYKLSADQLLSSITWLLNHAPEKGTDLKRKFGRAELVR